MPGTHRLPILPRVFAIVTTLGLAVGAIAPTLAPPPVRAVPSPNIVISEVYGGGGNTARRTRATSSSSSTAERAPSTCRRGVSSTHPPTGTTWQRTNLAGSIPPGGLPARQEATGAGCSGSPCGVPLPTPDATGADPDGGRRRQGGPRHQSDDDPDRHRLSVGRDPGPRRLRDRHELLRGRRPDREPHQHDLGAARRSTGAPIPTTTRADFAAGVARLAAERRRASSRCRSTTFPWPRATRARRRSPSP